MLPGLIDLASEIVGGKALSASDEFFAPKENLLKADAPTSIPIAVSGWMAGNRVVNAPLDTIGA
jgi:allantoicase